MTYGSLKNTPRAMARLSARVARKEAADKAAAEKEIEEARGTIMTQIDCPACNTVFDLEGDRDGETVNCPDCNVPLKVRRF